MIRARFLSIALAAFAALSSAQAADSITLHFYRSPGLNWYGPRALAKSVYRARKVAFPIGHVTMDIQCGSRMIRTGMAEARPGEAQSLVKGAKYGLGILFHSSEGALEETKPAKSTGEPLIDYYLRAQSETGRLKALRINVSRESCERMVKFYDTYRARNMQAYYGLPSRPLYGEGGGCSAYAMAFLEAGGLLTDWMIQDWANFVRVQSGVVGGPLTGYRVGFLGLMLSGDKRWSSTTARHFPMFFYDPDRMFKWVDELQKTRRGGNAGIIPFREFAFGRGGGVEIDMSSVKPDVNAPIFKALAGDPRETLRDPSQLYSRWANELAIWEKAHPNGALEAIVGEDDASPLTAEEMADGDR